jgi:RNA polymerase sigma factor (sigma-70 family)
MSRLQFDTAVHHLCRLAGAGGPADVSEEELLDAFAQQHDERAFAALIGRHAALVMGVCRRALGHHQDAEDACQATFLVLARNAASIRRHGSLAAFLHGVAYRVAMNAKRNLARQRRRDHQGARTETTTAVEDLSWREVQTLLDEEVQELPEVYRRVFVLCCLQGHSRAEAARQLGLKEGTVDSRLARAREQMRQRLEGRGVTLSTLMAVLDLAPDGASVGAATIRATARAAVAYAAGLCASSTVPARVLALADGVSITMLSAKTKCVALILVAAVLAGLGTLLAAQPPQTEGRKEHAAKPPEVRGLVLDPEGKPVKGAKVYQVSRWLEGDKPQRPPRLLAQTDAAGKFGLDKAPQARDASEQWMAVAAGFGPALLDRKAVSSQPTFRLVKDDVPIVGRVVSLEGQPIQGATIRPFFLYVTPREDLQDLLKVAESSARYTTDPDGSPLDRLFSHRVASGAGIPGLPERVTTDAAGRFRLTGAGRERVVWLEVSGPNIETEIIIALTRAGKPFRVRAQRGRTSPWLKAYPATFQYAANPGQPVIGTVRDVDTGRPIAGVTISPPRMGALLLATTAKDGTYRLRSLPSVLFEGATTPSVQLQAEPPADQPYLPGARMIVRGPCDEPLRVDFALARGVWAEGRVIDGKTGKPVRASIAYHPDTGNAQLKAFADYEGRQRGVVRVAARADGSFRLPVLLGQGVLTAWVATQAYLKDESLSDEEARRLLLPPGGSIYAHAIARIDAKAGETLKCDLRVDPGRTLVCQLVDADGKPVTGVQVRGLTALDDWTERPLSGAEFTLLALHPKRARWILVVQPSRQLGASVEVKTGEKQPLVIRLQPTGTIAGRLLGPDGRPLVGRRLLVEYAQPGKNEIRAHLPAFIRTDSEGHFRVQGAVADLSYRLTLYGGPPLAFHLKNLILRPGEIRDLGDVKARQRTNEQELP